MQFDIKLNLRICTDLICIRPTQDFMDGFPLLYPLLFLLWLGLTYGGLDITYTVLYIAFGIIFLLYMPVTLWLRSKSALAASEVLRGTLHYLVDEKGFTVSQGGGECKPSMGSDLQNGSEQKAMFWFTAQGSMRILFRESSWENSIRILQKLQMRSCQNIV